MLLTVFSTAFELRGADLTVFSCTENLFVFLVKNVLLLKFYGLRFYGIWSHFEALTTWAGGHFLLKKHTKKHNLKKGAADCPFGGKEEMAGPLFF
jgi:hypothetical protein